MFIQKTNKKILKCSLAIIILFGLGFLASHLFTENNTNVKAADNTYTPFEYETQSLKFHVNWLDYGNEASRPSNIKLVLNNTETNISYNLLLSKNQITFENNATYNEFIENESLSTTKTATALNEGSQWTLRIDNLKVSTDSPSNKYQLSIADSSKTELEQNYNINQSGSTLTLALKNYNYTSTSAKENAWLATRNGKLYDATGNLIVLKGVVTANLGTSQLENMKNPTILEALKDLGVNSIRITMQVKSGDATTGYVFNTNGEVLSGPDHEAYIASIHQTIREIVEQASQYGIYSIIDWGVLEDTGSLTNTALMSGAENFFGQISQDFANNPYVLYEICNEPHNGTNVWQNEIIPYAQNIISIIRANTNGIIIVAPKGSATKIISDDEDDPVNRPLTDNLGNPYSNIAYTYHSYPYNYAYNDPDNQNATNNAPIHSWRIKQAIDEGLTLIVTEMSTINAVHTQNHSLFDNDQMAKYAYLYYMNDISFNYFRFAYIGANDSANPYTEWNFIKRINYDYYPGTTTEDITNHLSNLDLSTSKAKDYQTGYNTETDEFENKDVDKLKGLGVYTNSGCWFYNFMTNNAFYKLPDYSKVQLKYSEYDIFKNDSAHESEPARPSTLGGTDYLIMNSYDVYYYLNGTNSEISNHISESRRYCSEYNASNKIKDISGYRIVNDATTDSAGAIKGDTKVIYHYKKIPDFSITKDNVTIDSDLELTLGENTQLNYTYPLKYGNLTLNAEDVATTCTSSDEASVECSVDEQANTITLTPKKATSSPATIIINTSEGTQFTSNEKQISISILDNSEPPAENNYTINYNLNSGSSGANAPTTGTYNSDIIIPHPTKTVTVIGEANNSSCTPGAATSGTQTFAGWTSTTLSGSALTGSSVNDISTSWNGVNATTNQYFKNLRSDTGAVTMIANWTPVAFYLPALTAPTGHTCKWYTNTTGTNPTNGYDSRASYSPTANSPASITMYAKATPNQYTCTKQYRLQNADGSWGDYITDETSLLYYGSTCSYTKAMTDYKNSANSANGSQANGACTINTNGCTVSLDFYRNTYTLTINKNDTYISNATTNTEPAHDNNFYRWGQAISISAIVKNNSRFTNWSQSGATGTFESTADANTTFLMSKGNVTISANGEYDEPIDPDPVDPEPINPEPDPSDSSQTTDNESVDYNDGSLVVPNTGKLSEEKNARTNNYFFIGFILFIIISIMIASHKKQKISFTKK